MSPSVSIDPRHTRSTSTNGGGAIDTGGNTTMNGVDSYKTGPRVYSHIEDLMNVRPQVDINSPIRKILQDAEMIAKQADSLLDFHRPELALQEYLRASIIVAEIIPRHKDYPSLHTNNGDLHRVHKGLMKRIKAQDAKFDAVIQTIKDNNSRNGTQATRNLLTNSISVQNSDHSSIVSKSSGTSSSGSNGVQGRKKPLVQPKPEGLHGRPLQTSSQPTAKPQISQIDTDLATRFARLRSLHPQNAMNAQSVLQDSRIRTQPILIPNSPHAPMYSPLTPRSGKGSTTVRPVGPRELPSIPLSAPSQSKIPLDVQIPAMPKPPDAIYSPASSADAASINLPSSVTRSSSYLGNPKNSAPPISRVVATPAITDHRLDYFSPAHKVENPGSAQDPNKRYLLNSPGDLYLSAEALVDYLGLGTQTLRPLIVDLRSREQFDSGHVMAQSIICIEPITIREGISAEEIGESIILSPDAEQKLYDKRHEFDLVVFYDQSSSALEIGTTGHSQGNKYLEQFSKAVYDYGYEKQLRQRPLLLRGGLDAWVDLMGPGSLKSSTPSSGGMLKPSRPVGRMSITRDFRGNSLRGARQSRPFSRPFSKEEETKWDEAIKGEADNKDKLDDPDSEEFSYARTTEDFFRKYPELPSIQESMISQPRFPIREEHNEFDAVVPRPPARPPPALPRQRSSGISEKSPTATYAMTSTSNSITPLSSKAGLTGLNNLHSVTCYVNSVIQCLSATPIIRQYLLNEYTYSKDSCPPKKDDEQGPPPQLLTRNLTNLLRILWSGQYDWVMPKTFLNYVNALYAKKLPFNNPRRDGICGTGKQHDAHEFLDYIFNVIFDELNIHRDKPDYQLTSPDPKLQRMSTIQSCIHEWKRYGESHQSALSDRFSGLVCESLQCSHCPYTNRQFTSFGGYYTIYFPSKYHQSPPAFDTPTRVGIRELLEDTNNFGRKSEKINEWKCETCGNHQGIKSTKFAYLPEYLVFHFSRFGAGLSSSKVKTHIDLSSLDVDMGPFHITADDDVQADPGYDAGFQKVQKYEAYAAAMHQGNSLDGGHYVALTRNPDANTTSETKRWHVFNDRQVSPGNFKDLENRGFVVAVLFLKRKS